jgi:electron transfer flavoprotein beta subunit
VSALTPRIAVLASLGRNPVNGAARPNREDVLALEIGRQLGREVSVLHAGSADEEAVKDFLAYGTARLEVVPLADGGDVAEALAPSLEGYHLILAGSRSEGGEGSGLVPYMIAERLRLPVVTQALEVSVVDGAAEILQFLPKGQRRRVRVRLPAVVVVHRAAAVTPRFAYARRAAGQVVVRPAPAAAENATPAWRTEPATGQRIKFRAPEKKSGHARMQFAVAAEAKGGTVFSEGTPADKAQAILSYLREHRLIYW